MKQYHDIKSKHRDSILFFRLGDFYEMFGADAKTAAPVLEVALTKRQDIPMCGIPHHAINSYVAKLLKKGLKVAICEQKGAPVSSGSSKKLFSREVVRTITPGTILEENILKPKVNNFLGCILPSFKNNRMHSAGCAWADISTGEFMVTEITENVREVLESEIARFSPAEVILPSDSRGASELLHLLKQENIPVNFDDDWNFNPDEAENSVPEFFRIKSAKVLRLDTHRLSLGAANAIVKFIEKTHPANTGILRPPRYYSPKESLVIDQAAIENLELLPRRDRPDTSLLEAIDSTITPMGGRKLRNWMLYPLIDLAIIRKRQDSVKWFMDNGLLRKSFRDELKKLSDFERILSRTISGRIYPRDLTALRESLKAIPELKKILSSSADSFAFQDETTDISEYMECLHELPELTDMLDRGLSDEPPATFKQNGCIKTGFDPGLDELKDLTSSGRKWIVQLESKERARTGISNLRVGYTGVFGYYIEVTKSNLNKVPDDYTRKQTLSNAERFATEELKEYENKILGAEEKIAKLEEKLLEKITHRIISQKTRILDISESVARLDCLSSFAETASINNYCIPVMTDTSLIDIKDGRHPVVEKGLSSEGGFIANDIYLDGIDAQILIITGPNMSGKSTYLRQNALLVIMAQMGSGCPAREATIGIVDQIFTRIGASDNLSKGESTFMVEMRETSTILHNLSPRSLVILDEVGRGTSTYDGISIAWAVLEYMVKNSPAHNSGFKPRVLFATHYFELTDLEGMLPGVLNFNVSVKEWKDRIIFLKKIVRGSADRSYGIHVAQLAGLPAKLIERAREILGKFENGHNIKNLPDGKISDENEQLKLFEYENTFLLELKETDPEGLTPLDAHRLIINWKERFLK